VAPAEPKRILLIRLRAVGDVVLVTPLLRALRRRFPDARIDALAEAGPASVLLGNPHIDRLLLPPRRRAPLREQAAFLRKLRAEGYDWVLDLFGNPRSAWMTLFSGAPLRAGYAYRVRRHAFTHPVEGNRVRRYQVLVNQGVLDALGVPADGIATEMFLESAERDWASTTLEGLGFRRGPGRPLVALAATGTWPIRRWPGSYWRELISLLNRDPGEKPLLLWGPGEEADLNRIVEGIAGQVRVAPRTDLRQLAALLSKADLLIGNNSAPQHIARALGVATLTIDGPTWGLSWCPPSDPRHRFLQHFTSCGPCDRTECPHPALPRPGGNTHKECLTKIPPSRVAAVAREMLAMRAGGPAADGRR
jgi:ADP-heptose:LPS heptosyltransferase